MNPLIVLFIVIVVLIVTIMVTGVVVLGDGMANAEDETWHETDE